MRKKFYKLQWYKRSKTPQGMMLFENNQLTGGNSNSVTSCH